MALVAHFELPTFAYLKEQGEEILELGQAIHEDTGKLHIGFLNLMPDAAFKVTERQFLRLLAASNQSAQIYVYPFTIEGVKRDDSTQAYIDDYYASFEVVKTAGLDALIITGTNPANSSLEQEPFWDPLGEVVDWATENVTSVLCSCLAVHAIVKHLHNIDRLALEQKRWGVYSHQIMDNQHPLLNNMSTHFDVPHSRNNDISINQLETAGFKVLAHGDDGGVALAVSPDLFRLVYLQGHPEYDGVSLLKEYKREVSRFFLGEREDFPENPENYFNPPILKIIKSYREVIMEAKAEQLPLPLFPEKDISPHLKNTWRDPGNSIFNNWLNLVFKTTNIDRHEPFSEGVDPDDPLQLKSSYP